MSVREKHLDVALEPPEQFGELAQGVSPCRVGRKTEGRRRRATRECAGLIMKRAKRIVPFKHALLLRFAEMGVSGHALHPSTLQQHLRGSGNRNCPNFDHWARFLES